GGQRVAMRQGSSAPIFLLGDHLGSTSKTYNTANGTTTELRYTPWGGTRYTAGTTPTSFQYTGQRKDATGLYFYNQDLRKHEEIHRGARRDRRDFLRFLSVLGVLCGEKASALRKS
ncbi:MAG TPA: hypothetical protein PKH77_22205, partial [Anaerolineae bacterium]|nr:hypothetical protein [Anaerolineae bacterium]